MEAIAVRPEVQTLDGGWMDSVLAQSNYLGSEAFKCFLCGATRLP
jgi:hypothetical protein